MASAKDKKSALSSLYSAALHQAPEYVAGLFAEQPEQRLYFHSYDYCVHLSNLVMNGAAELNINPESAFKLRIVAWFYAVGRLFEYENFLPDSHRLMKEYLSAYDIAPADMPSYDFFRLDDSGIDDHLAVGVLKDSLTVIRHGLADYHSPEILKKETEDTFGINYSDQEWNNISYHDLSNKQLCTSWGVRHFSSRYNLALLNLRQQPAILAQDNKPAKPKNNFNPTIYNFFRISFRNHIELSAMADNRSHIMISVNSIMMGIMISFITYQNLPATNPSLLLPVVVFIITGMTSLIFAILAAKPRMWRNITKHSSEEEILKHLTSYSDFANLSVEQYEEKLDQMFASRDLVKTNLKKELYYLGKILDTKNRYLVFSYNVFMFGFVVSMIIFLSMLIWS